VPKDEIAKNFDFIQNVFDALNILNKEDPNPLVTAALNFCQKLTSFGMRVMSRNEIFLEREALYNLKVEVLENPNFKFTTD